MGKDSDGKPIWDKKEDGKYLEKIKNVRLYESITVDKGVEPSGDFVYADDELLDRIRHAEFSDEIYISKGAGYLGVAELENGEEMYLEFERHYNDFFIIGKWGHYSY